MFDKSVIKRIYDDKRVAAAMGKLNLLEDQLNESFFDSEKPIKAVILALATQSSVLFDGPPGVAKSAMIRRLCNLIDVLSPTGEAKATARPAPDVIERGDYFEYLLSPFTEPTELFGSYKIDGMGGADGRLERHDENMVQRCRVVFLDEIFNASSAILNGLLALMNERLFHDRGQVMQADMKVLFAATNEELPPREKRLGPVYDRFVYRCHIGRLMAEPENLSNLMKSAWRNQTASEPALHDLLDTVETAYTEVLLPARADLWAPEKNDSSLKALNYIVDYAQRSGLGTFSNRRVVQLCDALLVNRLLRAHRAGALGNGALALEDFELAWTYFLDRTEPLDDNAISHFMSVAKHLKTSKKEKDTA